MDVDLYSTNDGIVEDAGEHPNDWVDQPISQNVARKTHAETTAKTKRSQINYYSKAYIAIVPTALIVRVQILSHLCKMFV